MSVFIWSQVWKLDLKPYSKLVLLKLADCADENGRNAYPAVPTIARECGFCERTAQRRLKEFIDSGVLVVERYMKGGRRPRHYRIDLKRAQELHPLPPSDDVRGDNNCHPRNDTSDAEGCQSLSPEPSLIVNEQEGRSNFTGDGKSDARLRSYRTDRKRVQDLHPLSALERKRYDQNRSRGIHLWNSKLEGVISHFGENVFNQWITLIDPISDNGKTITLAVPTRFILDQVRKYSCDLEGLLGREVKLIKRTTCSDLPPDPYKQ